MGAKIIRIKKIEGDLEGVIEGEGCWGILSAQQKNVKRICLPINIIYRPYVKR